MARVRAVYTTRTRAVYMVYLTYLAYLTCTLLGGRLTPGGWASCPTRGVKRPLVSPLKSKRLARKSKVISNSYFVTCEDMVYAHNPHNFLSPCTNIRFENSENVLRWASHPTLPNMTPHRSTTYVRTNVRPIVTDQVAWSVRLSLGLSARLRHTSEPCKNG